MIFLMESPLIDRYLDYISVVRRYSERTCGIYAASLDEFCRFAGPADDDELIASLIPNMIRGYEVALLDRKLNERTVNLHISVNRYFAATQAYASDIPDLTVKSYEKRLYRAVISTLYNTGIRRSELVGLRRKDMDFSRHVMRVHGKGDKTREIPLLPSFCQEISLYLQAVDTMAGSIQSGDSPLFVTAKGIAVYPRLVDRIVRQELGEAEGFSGRKSPHVLRHTVATELLDDGVDLNSIKEFLGHSSLAATQVYTHNSIEKLKNVYESAHPRAKNGGKNGD